MQQHYPFQNTPLPYDYNELEPYIDELTMHLHHDKHLQTYINNLNNTLKNHPQFHTWTLEELLYYNQKLPLPIRLKVWQNAGGVYNHFFFFDSLANHEKKEPKENTLNILNIYFDSFDNFKSIFKQMALDVFGSGYAWLVVNENRNFEIIKTPNQDTPILQNKIPILNIDVWEHSYYLKNYNDRSSYIDNFFEVINWEIVEDRINELSKLH